MPQLSLYIDEDTLQKLETGAKTSKTSISKYVTFMLREHFSQSWPADFKDAFGSITDDTFIKQDAVDFSCDVERECL